MTWCRMIEWSNSNLAGNALQLVLTGSKKGEA